MARARDQLSRPNLSRESTVLTPQESQQGRKLMMAHLLHQHLRSSSSASLDGFQDGDDGLRSNFFLEPESRGGGRGEHIPIATAAATATASIQNEDSGGVE
eukprot:CAMPEP_0195027606 /NCGR_PEP_ID=MMETSP0326_2-20130528/52624_1 /TAXON_ID=2866 ORGANISM="Crypthecodinium cohnii, Strain Seligo" /NCGR_SAMPLE_ID=MMETSP0326_2 /ASSEMBLY_ACC=CAM_ASM_000348 /LENGTH=100 /DNA_ID=CAMNT_0040049849 /DNA_START=282 /DNA_END=583 /DNA_ORIENTATION=+